MCEVIQHQNPSQVHPDNWLPLLIYDKVTDLSPSLIYQYGLVYGARPTMSIEVLRLLLDLHGSDLTQKEVEYIVDCLGMIHSIYERTYNNRMQVMDSQAQARSKSK